MSVKTTLTIDQKIQIAEIAKELTTSILSNSRIAPRHILPDLRSDDLQSIYNAVYNIVVDSVIED
ncbi:MULTISPECIES: hypothetical protein [Pectobacterium]|uniref:hypothetical protein n=1 Tax=Pectobacterium TaxID=122277 RepID=UPI001373C578|nr:MULTISPECIES: hypothetical protein [Pectobacterium]QHP82384.1 hypothetical protein EO763_22235 [Pectobacterium odoriferum]WCG83798.1 hypothetical protein O1Q74_03615 [Pectobacterium sp. A5351]